MKKKIDKTKLFGKIMAAILVIIMVVAAGGTLIYYLVAG